MVDQVNIVNKETGERVELNDSTVQLSEASVVSLPTGPENIAEATQSVQICISRWSQAKSSRC